MTPSTFSVDHVGEMILRVSAPTLPRLLEEAGKGLARLLLREEILPDRGAWRDIAIETTDRDTLMADWLNELLFLAETEQLVATDFDVSEAGSEGCRARVRGPPLASVPSLVKAATYHRLRLEESPEGFQAEVVLDV